LDKSVIIASADTLFQPKDGGVGFYDRRQLGEWSIFRPAYQDREKGRLMLWLYFAISAALNLSEGNNTHHILFTAVAERQYRLKLISSLASASTL
jgi:hypothetical protein